jgi:hypothetical protein
MRKTSMSLVLAGLVAVTTAQVGAVELRRAEIGTVVTDGIVQVGDHKYPLPPGEWRLVAKEQHKVLHTGDLSHGADILSGYFINTKGNQFRAGIQIAATEVSTSTRGWEQEPCKRDDVVFKDSFDSGYNFPECLIVNHYLRHLSPTKGWMNDAVQWVETNRIAMPVTTLAALYDKYQNGDFVRVHVWVNPELAGQKPSKNTTSWRRSDWHKDRVNRDPERSAYLEKFIAWAKQMPTAYRSGLDTENKLGQVQDFPGLAK